MTGDAADGERQASAKRDSATGASAKAEAADRRFPARPFLAASCLVVRDGRVLLAQRAAPPLVWSAPGGVVEAGESLVEGALRELAEETGVTAQVLGLVGYLEHIAWERGDRRPADARDRVLRHYVIMCFAARWTGGDGQTGPEAPALAWLRPDEAARLPVTGGLLDLIQRALDMESGGPCPESTT